MGTNPCCFAAFRSSRHFGDSEVQAAPSTACSDGGGPYIPGMSRLTYRRSSAEAYRISFDGVEIGSAVRRQQHITPERTYWHSER